MVVAGGFLLIIGIYFWGTNNRAKINILGKYQGNAGAVLTFLGAIMLGFGVA